MNDLKQALKDSSLDDYNDLLEKIERRYDLGLEAGLSDTEIEEMLGDVDTIVDQYMDTLIDEDDDNKNTESAKSYTFEVSTIAADISIDLVESNDIYRDVYESQVGNTDLDVEGGEL
jgi:uncharacterized membrane protein